MQPKQSLAYRRSRRPRNRSGAILLDLFMATLIFAACVLTIGQLGSQSIQVATTNATERLAVVEAESALAKELARGAAKGAPRVWSESIQGLTLAIRATWKETEQPQLFRVTIDVARSTDFGRTLVTLSRLVCVEGP